MRSTQTPQDQLPTQPTLREAIWHRISIALIAIVWAPSITAAQLPSDPASPLVLGEMLSFPGGLDHSVTSTPDGATWIAWVDSYCLGTVRIQRIAPDGSLLIPDGFVVEEDTSCGVTFPPLLAACSDNSVVLGRIFGSLGDAKVHRIGPKGQRMWGPDGIVVDDDGNFGTIGGVIGLPEGDVLIAWHSGSTMLAQRYSPGGTPVWPQAASIPTNTSSNRRIFAAISDGADGVIVFWDSPLSYKQIIWAVRFDQFGDAAWDEPLLVVPPEFGSSLHTDPVAMSDGVGGAIVAWTEGREQQDVPSKLFVQQVTGEGTLAYEQPGVRVSLEATRQYQPQLHRDELTGDVFIAWRDGAFDAQTLKAQRMTMTGDRLWGDNGVAVAPLGVFTSHFDGSWTEDKFTFAVSDEPILNGASVNVYRVHGDGNVDPAVTAIPGATATGPVHTTLLNKQFVAVTWLILSSNPNDHLAAQRLNPNGTLEHRPRLPIRIRRR